MVKVFAPGKRPLGGHISDCMSFYLLNFVSCAMYQLFQKENKSQRILNTFLKSQQLSAAYKVKTPQRGVQGIHGAAHLSRLSSHLPSH